MDTAKRAIDLLRETERRLGELVGQAATAGEYDVAVRLAEWAKTLGILAQPTDGEAAVELLPPGAARAGNDRVPPPQDPPKEATVRRTRRQRRPAKGEFPKFLRRGDLLVKLGWSRTEQSPYEHKAPRGVVELLATVIAKKATNKRVFTAEDLLPLIEPQGGSEVPSYQAYLCLAWLRAEGWVKQHGRRGYSVRNATGLKEAVEAAWLRLPEANS